MDNSERIERIRELEEKRAKIREELHGLSNEINKLKQPDYWQKYYSKYNKKRIPGSTTCEQMMGKRRCELTPDELRKYNRLKQAERRKKLKEELKNEI